jgi:diguanylate cyclase (GGDEF)-like protein
LLEQWSLEDALTGIANRRHFEQVLAERLRIAAVSGKPINLALIDVDQFKSVNDKFTHQVGDRVLRTLAGILSNQVREHDLAARLSGDEFVVMFARADSPDAEQVCGRIRAAVAAFDWRGIAPGLCLSVSVGISQSAEGDTVESLLHRSDIAMYQGKPGANLNLWAGG